MGWLWLPSLLKLNPNIILVYLFMAWLHIYLITQTSSYIWISISCIIFCWSTLSIGQLKLIIWSILSSILYNMIKKKKTVTESIYWLSVRLYILFEHSSPDLKRFSLSHNSYHFDHCPLSGQIFHLYLHLFHPIIRRTVLQYIHRVILGKFKKGNQFYPISIQNIT